MMALQISAFRRLLSRKIRCMSPDGEHLKRLKILMARVYQNTTDVD